MQLAYQYTHTFAQLSKSRHRYIVLFSVTQLVHVCEVHLHHLSHFSGSNAAFGISSTSGWVDAATNRPSWDNKNMPSATGSFLHRYIYIYRNYLNIHTHMHTCRPSPVTHYPFHSCNLVRKLHGIWDHQPELRQWLLKYLFKPLTFPPKSFAMMCRPNNHTQITSFWHNNKIGQKKSIIDGFSVSLKGNLGMKEIKTLAKKNKRHLRYSMHGIIMYIWSISWCMQVNIPIQNEHLGTQTPMFGLRIWSEATNHPTLTEV